MDVCKATAFIISSRGTRSAASANRAGICTAINPPRMKTTVYTCHIWANPVRARMARPMVMAALPKTQQIKKSLRSTRSAMTPPAKVNTRLETPNKLTARPNEVFSPVRSRIRKPMPRNWIPCPKDWTPMFRKNRRKSRWRRAEKARNRPVAAAAAMRYPASVPILSDLASRRSTNWWKSATSKSGR